MDYLELKMNEKEEKMLRSSARETNGLEGQLQIEKKTTKTNENLTDNKQLLVLLFFVEEMNFNTTQKLLLIWLDKDISRSTTNILRQIVNAFVTFTDIDECLNFLITTSESRVCMIVSGSLGKEIVPTVHDMRQMDSIFVFSQDVKVNEEWTRSWPKIVGIFKEIGLICDELKKVMMDCEQNSISFDLMTIDGDPSKKNLDQLQSVFMYSQIIKEILLVIKFEQKHIREFAEYCRQEFRENIEHLTFIDRFEREYRKKTPIWWYTCQSFLYPMVNKALREANLDLIIKMGFFISDLHRHIEQLHKKQFIPRKIRKTFTLYRGIVLSLSQLHEMTNNKGGLIFFNMFLSTSSNLDIAQKFAQQNLSNPSSIGVIFVMTIDPRQLTTPFASVDEIGYYKKEREILFSMHTVFRINDIKQTDANSRLFQVELSLTSEKDLDLHLLTERIRQETCPDINGWQRLGFVLLRMRRALQAEHVYQILLKQKLNDLERACIYNQLGSTKDELGEYDQALEYYDKVLDIYKKLVPINYQNMGACFNNIGTVHYNKNDYSKALAFYETALNINKQWLPGNHSNCASVYNNIGKIYEKTGDYSKALLYFKRALTIRQEILLRNHSTLAYSFDNLGLVYYAIGEYHQALSFHEEALHIRQKSLPPDHPDLAYPYHNIGLIYNKTGDYSKAILSYEKALDIRLHSLSSNHPELAISYDSIGDFYARQGDQCKALDAYEKALSIRQTVRPNHPIVAISYNNIGKSHTLNGNYSQAFSFFEKALEIQIQSLPSCHPDLAISYQNMGDAYFQMRSYSQVLPYYTKALTIQQQSSSTNRIDIANTYDKIGLLSFRVKDWSEALSCYENALKIRRETLCPMHPDIAISRNNIGLLYIQMSMNSQAFVSFEKALDIQIQTLTFYHADLAVTYNNIGLAYVQIDDREKALAYFEKALSIQQEILPCNHHDLAQTFTNLGGVYHHLQNYSRALASYEKTLEILQQYLPENHADIGECCQQIGLVCKNMNNHGRSVSYLKRASSIAEQTTKTSLSNLTNKLSL